MLEAPSLRVAVMVMLALPFWYWTGWSSATKLPPVMGLGPVITTEEGNKARLSEAEAVTVRLETAVSESLTVKLTLELPFSGMTTGVVVVILMAGLVTTVR